MNLCRSMFRRIIELDMHIRNGWYPNCKVFAQEWEVSRKTIQRDIDFLKAHDAPIEYSYEKRGFYYKDGSWMLPMMDLTEAELLELLMAANMARQYKGTPIANSLDSLFDKLQMALTDKVTVDPVFFKEQFSFHGEPSRKISQRIWKSLFKALRGDRVIVMTYHTPGKTPKEREVEPLHMACVAEEWYLVAFDRSSDQTLHFSVSRIEKIHITKEIFEPDNFDPKKYFSNRFGRFIGKPDEAWKITVHFNSEAAPWILEKQWHIKQKIEQKKDGSLVLSFPAPSLYEVKRWVLQWGADAEVIEPSELRDEVVSEVRNMTKVY